MLFRSNLQNNNYQWQICTNTLTSTWSNLSNNNKYAGVTDDTLKIYNVNFNDDLKLFRCNINNVPCSFQAISPTMELNVGVNLVASAGIITSKEILMHPNPSSDVIYLNTPFINSKFNIYDVYGKLIYTSSINNVQEIIEIKNWSNGVYLIHLPIENRLIKFIKE